jgi:hypothetical protein
MNQMIRVTGEGLDMDGDERKETEVVGWNSLITHSAIIVGKDGEIRNIDGALPPQGPLSFNMDGRTRHESLTGVPEEAFEVETDEGQSSGESTWA